MESLTVLLRLAGAADPRCMCYLPVSRLEAISDGGNFIILLQLFYFVVSYYCYSLVCLTCKRYPS